MSGFPTAWRQVQRLHLRAPDETLAGRGVRLLEDALRTASLPDAGARMILFRRLAFGRFGSGISAQSLSLALERRVAALRGLAIHAAAPAAAQSVVVWFRDALEAHTLLAQRIAENAPTHEWFWPLVVPGIERAGTAAQRLRAVLGSLGRSPEAPTALPLLARALAQRGHAHLLRAAVGAAEAAALLPAGAAVARSAAAAMAPLHARIPTGRDAEETANASFAPLARSPDGVPLLPKAEAAAPSGSERPAHVPLPGTRKNEKEAAASHSPMARTPGAVPILPNADDAAPSDSGSTEHPAPIRLTTLPSAPGPSATADESAPAPRLRTQTRRGISAPGQRAASEVIAAPRHHDRDLTAGDLTRPVADTPELRTAAQRSWFAPSEPAEHTHATPQELESIWAHSRDLPWPCERPTAAGGLLFLLPVLARLGYAQWLDEAPEWAPLRIDRRVLALACRRLELPADDPAWRLCATAAVAPPERYCAPLIWTKGIADCSAAWRRHADIGGTRLWDASGRLLLAAWSGGRRPAAFAPLMRGRRTVRCGESRRGADDLAMAVTEAWLAACRRWLRRSARLGVASLVARSARVSVTPTHADMFFEPSGVSLPIRRAGLDLDPGWVPWFGRVVAFHYRRMPWT